MRTLLQAAGMAGSLLLAQATGAADYTIDTVIDGLDNPWAIAFLPDGDLLVTEKPGRLLRVSADGTATSIEGVPNVYFKSQGGLMDVVLDPDYSSNGWLYLSYAEGGPEANHTAVARAKLEGHQLTDIETILQVSPNKDTAAHYGGKLAFMPDGTLLVSVGEGFEYREQAQDLGSELGKLLRIHSDGSIPADNPFPDIAPRVYSYGHRNPQGLAVHPSNGSIYMTEHGPKGGDEINRIEPGNNYGWPAITYGVDYSGAIISPYTEAKGMEQPLRYWVPSIALSGLALYTASMFDEYRGDAFIGALRDRKLYRLDMEAGAVLTQTEPFPDLQGRVRDVRVAPDGAIYAVVDEGAVYRISR